MAPCFNRAENDLSPKKITSSLLLFFAHVSVDLLGEDLLVCLNRKHGGENNDTRDRAALQVALEDI